MQKTTRSVMSVVLITLLFAPLTTVQAALLLGKSDREKVEEHKASADVEGEWLLAYYVGYHYEYLKPKDIDYTLMTHIVVGGIGVNSDGTLDEHWHMTDSDEGREMALDVGRYADREGVKKLIWLGGPNEEDKFYSATSDEYRENFVENIIKLLDELDYDGVDIDWEPIRTKDELGILKLVRDLREKDPDMLITVPVNWVPSSILYTKDLSIYDDLARYVDKMFIMSYSMAGPWSGWKSWYGAALTGDTVATPSSIKTSVYAYERAGVPSDQLGVGIGTYATCWEYPVKNPKQTLLSTYYSSRLHAMSMRTLMSDYYSSKNERWDSLAKVPYLTFKSGQGDFSCGFVSYENKESVQEKVEYVLRKKLGGVMVWNIGTGYYPENSKSKRNELLKEIWETLTD